MRFRFLLLTLLLVREIPAHAAAPLRYSHILCSDSTYDCLEVQPEDTWESLWENPGEREIVMKLNRMNVRLRKGMLLAIPKKFKKGICEKTCPFEEKIGAEGEKSIVVDLSKLAWAAYDAKGRLVRWGPASGGRDWCPDVHGRCRTPYGDFSVSSRGGSKCKSKKFPIGRGGAPMPYCMFFHGGYALHGSPEVPGYNASHGCVRLFREDAEWLNQDFVALPDRETGATGTRVIILPYDDPKSVE